MPNTYFDSDLTGAQIEAALTAIDGVVTQENNGKVLAIENGKIVAKSASEWTDTPVLEPLSVTANGDYTPEAGVDGFSSVHVAVSGGGGGTIEPLNVTQNGTYNPPSGVDGYAPVTVAVPSSGGEGPIYYGTSAPTSALGNDEDLYIQYSVTPDRVYAYQIDAEYRKVNGTWTEYDPINPRIGYVSAVRVWTASTRGMDASLFVQSGFFNKDIAEFYPAAEKEQVIYTSVSSVSTIKNCGNLVYLDYNVSSSNFWTLKAIHDISGYSEGDIVAQWRYSTDNDVIVYAL